METSKTKRLLTELDHIVIQCDNPGKVHHVLQRDLGLMDLTNGIQNYSFFSTGAVVAGNIILETLYFHGQSKISELLESDSKARGYGLIFTNFVPLNTISRHLRNNDVPHGALLPFHGKFSGEAKKYLNPEDQGKEKGLLYTNLLIPALISDKQAPFEKLARVWDGKLQHSLGKMMAKLINNNFFAKMVIPKTANGPVTVQVVEYNQQIEKRRKKNYQDYRKRSIEKLNIAKLEFVTVETTDFEQRLEYWSALNVKIKYNNDNTVLIQPDRGAKILLRPSSKNQITELVFTADNTARELSKLSFLVKDKDKSYTYNNPEIKGILIRIIAA